MFFKSATLSRRDVFKNTIWSGGFPSYKQVITLESHQLRGATRRPQPVVLLAAEGFLEPLDFPEQEIPRCQTRRMIYLA